VLSGQIDQGELTIDGAILKGSVTLSSGSPRSIEISARASDDIVATFSLAIETIGQPTQFSVSVPADLFPRPLRIALSVSATDSATGTSVGLPMTGPTAELRAINITSRQDFLRSVQSPTERLKNSSFLFYVSYFGLSRFADDFAARSAALCVMAYRIMEGVAVPQEGIDTFWAEVEKIIAERPNVPRGLWIRWHISVRLAAGYLAFRHKDTSRSATFFGGISEFAFELSHWPTATTNVLIGIFLAGWVRYQRGEFEAAAHEWRRADGVLRYGATLTNFSNFYAYGELENAIRVAQECYIGVMQAENGGKPVDDARIIPAGYQLDISHLPGLKYNLGL